MHQDKLFLDRIKKKDPAVFEDLYKEYKTVIYNYLLIKTRNDHDTVKDVLSETFCSVIDSAEKISSCKNLKSFLFQLAFRRLNDHLRKKYHDKNYDKYFDITEESADNMTEEAHKKEQLLMVNLAVDNLKPVYRDVLRLKYFEEKSQNEIAEIMNKSVSSVESLLVRARIDLKNELKNFKGFMNEIQ